MLCASGAGWEVYDTTASPYGYVLKSSGEDDGEMPVYVHIFQGTNTIVIYIYAGEGN